MEREILTNLEAKSKQVIAYWIDTWIVNATRNYSTIQQLMKSGRAISITKAIKSWTEPIVITGSGPTLDVYPFKEHKRAKNPPKIFASLSNASNWLANDIVPDYVAVVDGASGLADMNFPPGMEDDLESAFLVVPPTVSPSIFERWKGKFLLFRPMQPGNEFVMNTLPRMYSDMYEHSNLRDRLFIDQLPLAFMNAGCVVNSMTAAATYLGYEPIYLAGCDFGFPLHKQGCTRYRRTKSGKYIVESKQDQLTTDQVRRLSNNDILTTEEHLNYKMNLYLIWGATKSKIYNLSSHSILGNTVPVVEPQEKIFTDNAYFYNEYPIEPDALQEYCTKLCEEMGLKRPETEKKTKEAKPTISLPTLSAPSRNIKAIEVPQEVLDQIAEVQEEKSQ